MTNHIHLKICLSWFKALGFWPLEGANKLLAALQLIVKLTGLTVLVTMIISEYVNVYFVFGRDMPTFAALASYTLLYNVIAAKLYIITRPEIQSVVLQIEATEVGILESDDDEAKTIYKRYVNETYFLNYVWMALTYGCDVLFIITPIVTEMTRDFDSEFGGVGNGSFSRARLLPLVSWFPFDTNNHHKLAYSFHVAVLIVCTTYVIACNNFMNGLILFAVGQLKILQNELLNVENAARRYPLLGEDEATEYALRQCVVYHDAIIRFVQKLNSAMTAFLMFDFASCAMQIAVLVFVVAVSDISLIMLNTVDYLATMLVQLFLFYWYANELIVQSLEVGNAAYSNSWYSYSESNKRSLQIVMARTQQPLTLRVGPLYVMSTQTMVSIVRVGYSYATIMRRLYRK